MAHCPYEKISHLESLFMELRQWEKINETRPGIFYLMSKSFLHFHIKDDLIWADIKNGDRWERIVIPKKVSNLFLKKMATQVFKIYQDEL